MVTVHNFEKNKVSIPVKPIKIKPRIPHTEESGFYLDCSERFLQEYPEAQQRRQGMFW